MVEFAIFSVYMWILGIGGLVADYILPHIAPLARYIDSLPMMQEDADGEAT